MTQHSVPPQERVFDRAPSTDPRSLSDYPIRRLTIADQPLKSLTWRLNPAIRLDQLREGSCEGHAWTHELAARPVPISHKIATHDTAVRLYHQAQYADEYRETPPEEGSSTLGGAKVVQQAGYMDAYHWAASVEDIMRGIAYEGPGVCGSDWLDGMWDPRPSGLMEITGDAVGGHAYLIRGVVLKPRLKGESNVGPCLVMTNSWGPGWGDNGSAYLPVEDFETHIWNQGADFCLPIGRRDPKLATPFASS
jgi:hypothetical protein